MIACTLIKIGRQLVVDVCCITIVMYELCSGSRPGELQVIDSRIES